MLRLVVPGIELWSDEKQEFSEDPNNPTVVLLLEHSLRSVADWESKWKKPFFSSELRADEVRDYIRCMTLNEEPVPDRVYRRIGYREFKVIKDYMDDPYTATTFREKPGDKYRAKQSSGKFLTAEVIYYQMVMLEIPFEADRWNINRLMTLIRVCHEKQAPQEKKTKRELSTKYAAMNSARLAQKGLPKTR